MEDLIQQHEPMAKRIGAAMAGVCHLSPNDAQQEALLGLMTCATKYGDKLNAGMVAICVRNHLLSIAEKHNAQKRTGKMVQKDPDTLSGTSLSAEQLAIAADTERIIAEACDTLNMSTSQTLGLMVVLQSLSRTTYQHWIQSHPVEWSVWLDAAEMSPERAAEITPAEARRLFTRLMARLKEAR